MATAKVLNSPELLEIILLNIPLQYVLAAQRVCWHWRNVISSSPQIQRILFRKPAGDAVRFKHNWSNILECSQKTECERLYEAMGRLNEEHNAWVWAVSGAPFRGRVLINPFLLTDSPYINLSQYLGKLKINQDETSSQLEASWKQMLLTQPPVTEMIVDHGQANHWHVLRAENQELGLTGNDIARTLRLFETEMSLGILEGSCLWDLSSLNEHPKTFSGTQLLQIFKSGAIA